MSSITTGIIEINLFGEIQFVNKEAIRLLKKDRERSFRKSLLDNFENDELLTNIIQSVEEDQEGFETEFSLRAGKKKLCDISFSPVFDEEEFFGNCYSNR